MDNRPIGVFDSGLGGLTAVKELLSIMPNENIIYFGDTGRVPYGSRSRETITKYAAQDTAFLESKNVKMIIAACGTVSSVASGIGESLSLPYTGVLKPTAIAAAASTRNKKIGVIATTATIRSGSYRRELSAIDPEIEVFDRDCPLFVPLVENGWIAENEEVTRLVAQRYLTPLRESGIDTLIMGCTHYPIIRHFISEVMGSGVTLIDSGRETALYCSAMLKERGLLCGRSTQGDCSFYVSDRMEGFSQIAGIFLGKDIKREVSHVNIDLY
ncbi:glutamate racemase [Caproiciproducens faecalis]|uniref:Glutamate racemase n=1 Tax=Caproiciproducens faecalis TaxID=2820301 RepID=A0ABS7DJY5_9FIRM|nr:glutamate racemase [Caproiciproducens faecalis]MBW7571605.1 glutamate racemase [Caproiciproducens faecalis]